MTGKPKNCTMERMVQIMSRTEKIELTVLCLVEDGSKVLLQNRVKGAWRGYSFPGGHVEPGESITHAVIREIKEETGLDITNPTLVGVKNFPIDNGVDEGRYIVFLFKTTCFKGQVESSPEGEISWAERDALQGLNVVEDFFDTLRIMDDPALTELTYEKSADHSTYRFI